MSEHQNQLAKINEHLFNQVLAHVVMLISDRAYFTKERQALADTLNTATSFWNRKFENIADTRDLSLDNEMVAQLKIALFEAYIEYIAENTALSKATGIIFKNPDHIRPVCKRVGDKLTALGGSWAENRTTFEPTQTNRDILLKRSPILVKARVKDNYSTLAFIIILLELALREIYKPENLERVTTNPTAFFNDICNNMQVLTQLKSPKPIAS